MALTAQKRPTTATARSSRPVSSRNARSRPRSAANFKKPENVQTIKGALMLRHNKTQMAMNRENMNPNIDETAFAAPGGGGEQQQPSQLQRRVHHLEAMLDMQRSEYRERIERWDSLLNKRFVPLKSLEEYVDEEERKQDEARGHNTATSSSSGGKNATTHHGSKGLREQGGGGGQQQHGFPHSYFPSSNSSNPGGRSSSAVARTASSGGFHAGLETGECRGGGGGRGKAKRRGGARSRKQLQAADVDRRQEASRRPRENQKDEIASPGDIDLVEEDVGAASSSEDDVTALVSSAVSNVDHLHGADEPLPASSAQIYHDAGSSSYPSSYSCSSSAKHGQHPGGAFSTQTTARFDHEMGVRFQDPGAAMAGASSGGHLRPKSASRLDAARNAASSSSSSGAPFLFAACEGGGPSSSGEEEGSSSSSGHERADDPGVHEHEDVVEVARAPTPSPREGSHHASSPRVAASRPKQPQKGRSNKTVGDATMRGVGISLDGAPGVVPRGRAASAGPRRARPGPPDSPRERARTMRPQSASATARRGGGDHRGRNTSSAYEEDANNATSIPFVSRPQGFRHLDHALGGGPGASSSRSPPRGVSTRGGSNSPRLEDAFANSPRFDGEHQRPQSAAPQRNRWIAYGHRPKTAPGSGVRSKDKDDSYNALTNLQGMFTKVFNANQILIQQREEAEANLKNFLQTTEGHQAKQILEQREQVKFMRTRLLQMEADNDRATRKAKRSEQRAYEEEMFLKQAMKEIETLRQVTVELQRMNLELHESPQMKLIEQKLYKFQKELTKRTKALNDQNDAQEEAVKEIWVRVEAVNKKVDGLTSMTESLNQDRNEAGVLLKVGKERIKECKVTIQKLAQDFQVLKQNSEDAERKYQKLLKRQDEESNKVAALQRVYREVLEELVGNNKWYKRVNKDLETENAQLKSENTELLESLMAYLMLNQQSSMLKGRAKQALDPLTVTAEKKRVPPPLDNKKENADEGHDDPDHNSISRTPYPIHEPIDLPPPPEGSFLSPRVLVPAKNVPILLGEITEVQC
ncbi:unnamed protein product [Amoebophrya sp. A25]|nr:unnamed protein product [Amoebophrya sp. A25]|eukprot:GSA25T00010533001.1